MLEFPDDVIWIFGATNEGNLMCNSPNDIISSNFESMNVDQNQVSSIRLQLDYEFEISGFALINYHLIQIESE